MSVTKIIMRIVGLLLTIGVKADMPGEKNFRKASHSSGWSLSN